jgi:hypothetical protein
MTTEEFIKKVNSVLEKNEIQDKHGNFVGSFKVLYGYVKVEGDFVQLTSVYPISKDMSVLFGIDRIFVFSDNTDDTVKVKQSAFGDFYSIGDDFSTDHTRINPINQDKPIYIAVNTNVFQEAEAHNFIKTLGHPPTFQEVNIYPPYVGFEGDRHVQKEGSYFF